MWDKKALQDDLDVHRQPKTVLQFCTIDSLSDKTNLMDMSSSLKASFLGGLVAVGGSAKYLRDAKSSSHQSRVIMHYSQTTRFDQLTMTELGKIIYPQVFDQQTATHVVTGVLYGAQAFMVFDHKAAGHEEKQQVKRDLYAVVQKVPCFSNDSQKMNENEKNLTEKVSVTFHGDYALQENPGTYMEALQVFKKLPSLLRDKEHDAVPVRVWLHPLKLLNEKAALLVRQISEGLVSKAERMLGELLKVERRCNDLFQERSVQDFLDLKKRLQAFQEMYSDYKTALQKALFRVLPAIRSGTQEELVLANIVIAHYKSAFAPGNLNQWLDDFTTELDVLKSCISGLKDIRIVPSAGQLNSILFNPAVDVVVCLAFTSLKDISKDPYLDALKDFVNSEACVKLEQPNPKVYAPQATQPWFTSLDIAKNMKQNLSLFTSFSTANKTDTKIRFIVASIPDPSNPGASIQLYEKGKLTNPKFQPVSKPPPPMVDGSVTLRLQKSPTGETVQFRVEYMKVIPGQASQAENWEFTDTTSLQKPSTLTGMQPGNQYFVRYRAVGVVGVSEASDSVRVVVQASCTVVPPVPTVITDEREYTVSSHSRHQQYIFFTSGVTNLAACFNLTFWLNVWNQESFCLILVNPSSHTGPLRLRLVTRGFVLATVCTI